MGGSSLGHILYLLRLSTHTWLFPSKTALLISQYILKEYNEGGSGARLLVSHLAFLFLLLGFNIIEVQLA